MPTPPRSGRRAGAKHRTATPAPAPAAIAAAVLLMACLTLAAGQGEPPLDPAPLPPPPGPEVTLLLPDLQVLPPSDLHLVDDREAGGALRLKFATTLLNAGPGPLEVRGVRHHDEPPADAPDRSEGRYDPRSGRSWQARQAAYDERGVAYDVGIVGRLDFEHRHGHLHLVDFVRFELWSLDQDGTPLHLVAVNDKIGFCLMDNLRVDEALAAAEPHYLDCDERKQGISPGFGDVYVAALFEQDLDVTDLPAGRYRLVNLADPEGNLLRRPGPAVASVDLILEAGAVRAVPGSERTGAAVR